MGRYKLIALDMDGTLLNSKTQISEGNKKSISEAAEAGVTVCLATGRGYQQSRSFAKELGLSSPLVLVNGGELWKSPMELWRRHVMEPARIAELREMALEYDVWYWAYSAEGVYNREQWLEGSIKDKIWLKFGYYTENAGTIQELRDRLAAMGGMELTNSSPHNIEINPSGVSKASGLKEVCGLLGIGMQDIIAVGDSLNDLAMIREAGLGVAMGNAQDTVKAAADAVTADHDADGVAQVIRDYILQG